MENQMNIFRYARTTIVAIALLLVLTFTTACGSTQSSNPVKLNQSSDYSQIARGNSAAGQDFGNWVVQTSKGLIMDAYVWTLDKIEAKKDRD